jgi:alkylhydroperoxidase/carboxymuconolactone decarboxylase family protein YurZ
MVIDGRTASLMAVAASVAANCERCLEINVTRSVRLGIEPAAIADAVEVGRKVRGGAAAKLDARAAGLDLAALGSSTADLACGCS